MKLFTSSIDATQFAIRRNVIQNGKEQTNATTKHCLFAETLTTASGSAAACENSLTAAQHAELIHLKLIRSSLTNNDRSLETDTTGSAATLLSLATTARQKSDATTSELTILDTSDNISATSTDVSMPTSTDRNISSLIARASHRYGVTEPLIKAVIHAESSFHSDAVSPAGAKGLMQLMPATCNDLGVSDPFNPEQNIMGGTRFLKNLLNRYGGNLDKALAAYNWGPGNLDRSKGRLPAETRSYLVKVKNLLSDYSNV